jgi:hypothetical protein
MSVKSGGPAAKHHDPQSHEKLFMPEKTETLKKSLSTALPLSPNFILHWRYSLATCSRDGFSSPKHNHSLHPSGTQIAHQVAPTFPCQQASTR